MGGPVRDQGLYCGSCWAFATLKGIQAQYKIVKGIDVELSVQQMIDCAIPDFNGCYGGWATDAYFYAMGNGIATASQLPY